MVERESHLNPVDALAAVGENGAHVVDENIDRRAASGKALHQCSDLGLAREIGPLEAHPAVGRRPPDRLADLRALVRGPLDEYDIGPLSASIRAVTRPIPSVRR